MPIQDLDYLQATYKAASIVRDRGFALLDSLFTPGERLWRIDEVDDLYERFISNPDESSNSFQTKLERQLSGASDRTIQLMAEIYYMHLLWPADIKPGTKRRNLEQVLSWMQHPVSIPPELNAGLEHGFGSAGMGFKSGRPAQLRYLIMLLREWVTADQAERERLLSDPWAFKAFAYDIDAPGSASQKNAILYLMFPDIFESTVSDGYKASIVEGFRALADDETDVDRALFRIHTVLEQEVGHPIDFYDPEIEARWKPERADPQVLSTPQPPEEEPTTGRAWLIRPGRSDRSFVNDWLRDGYCGIGWGEVGLIEPGTPYAEIKRRVRDTYPDATDGWVRSSAGNINRFINRVNVGDIVVAPNGDDIYVGVIRSDPFWSDVGQPVRRNVDWANPTAPIERAALSASSYSALRTLLTITDVSESYIEFAAAAGLEVVAQPPPADGVHLGLVDSDFADELYLPQDWLNDIVELLDGKRQVIFYGPPGTGKTHVARELADYLTGSEGVTLVQFHPSYTYEDFFEGYRPQTGAGGSVSFELVQGPLRRIAEAAANDPTHPYVLIIDEINRANLAKVFGELYFLLEYRNDSISLLYGSDDEFTLPKNLYIVGTMNTADRSIAFVDAAMRRRFYFIPFFPTQEPISLVLDQWLADRSMDDEPARLLDAINERIGDDDFAVGPSYLMSTTVGDDRSLRRIWDHAIIPLLEEHFFGTGRDVQSEFGLDSLRKSIAAESPGAQHEEPPADLAGS